MAVYSIVDYLKNAGQDSSYGARKNLAAQYGLTDYTGTASQNMQLLKNLQSGAKPSSASGGSGATTAPAPSPGMTGPSGAGQVGAAPGTSNVQAGAPGSTSGSIQTTEQKRSYQPSQRVNDLYTSLQNTLNSRPDDYEMSDRVQDYQDKLDEVEADKPDPFKSKYTDQINSILEGILNNKDFSYTGKDLMNDDLYQMYRDQYTHNAKLASQDAMAGAAGLTGGYGSTYSQAAGQQAYDNTMAQLNDMALEFADRAYDRYKWNQTDRYNQLGAVTGLDNTDYSRYRDTVGDWKDDRNYYAGRYDTEFNRDYGMYRDQVADWQADRQFGLGMYDTEYDNDFGSYQQTVSENQWQTEFDHNKAMDEAQLAIARAEEARAAEAWERQKAQEDAAMAAAAAAAASGGGGGGSSSRGRSSSRRKSSGSSRKTSSSKKTSGSTKSSGSLPKTSAADYMAAQTVGATKDQLYSIAKNMNVSMNKESNYMDPATLRVLQANLKKKAK